MALLSVGDKAPEFTCRNQDGDDVALGDFAGKHVVFVGDGNNVARSLAVACKLLGMN